MKRVLVSVTDKSNLEHLLPLANSGEWEFISTGGTAKALRELDIIVLDVAQVTGMQEMMDGRLKTLHPVISGGILAERSNPEHMLALEQILKAEPIDLVIVNLYDFNGKPGIESIDIGGPTMIRAAAKNHDSVTVVVNPANYQKVVDGLLSPDGLPFMKRRDLAADAFAMTSAYDGDIAKWLRSNTAT